jgi:hypothetical protein
MHLCVLAVFIGCDQIDRDIQTNMAMNGIEKTTKLLADRKHNENGDQWRHPAGFPFKPCTKYIKRKEHQHNKHRLGAA